MCAYLVGSSISRILLFIIIIQVADSNVETIQSLIDARYDLPLRDDDGATPLYHAVEHGHLDMVMVLLKAEAHVNARNKKRWTPLHMAAKNDHPDVIRVLIAAGADINGQTIRKMTPLIVAAKHACDKSTRALIEHGCDVNARDICHRTAVSWATKGGSLFLLNRLEAAGADITAVDKFNRTTLHQAVKSKNPDHLQHFLTKGLDITLEEMHCRTPIHMAASKGRVGCLEVLLNQGSSTYVDVVSSSGRTPLQMATTKCRYSCIKLLLERGADPNHVDGFMTTALHEVALTSRMDKNNPGILYNSALALIDGNSDMDRLSSSRTFWKPGHEQPQTALEIATGCAGCFGLIQLLARAGTAPGNVIDMITMDEHDMTSALRDSPQIRSWLKAYYKSPRSLKEQCRKVIRSSMSHPFYTLLDDWDIAIGLKDYLHFCDLYDLNAQVCIVQ